MPRRQKKYHYIYKTTCTVTGKFYVGMHSTDNLDDGYLGSGKILGYSRKKYGDENHKREIVEMLPSRDELKLREKEIVNEELLNHPLNINLKYGGDGGWDYLNDSSKQHLERCSRAGKIGGAISGTANIRKATTKESCALGGKNSWMKSFHLLQSDEARKKRKNTMKERNHMVGEKNSQFGTCWVTNGNPIKIKKELLKQYLTNGYVLGRKKF